MKLSLVYFLATVASAASNLNNLRRLDDNTDDTGVTIEDYFPDETPDEEDRYLAGCDEICRAKRRLVRCKKKAREERREGRKAYDDMDGVSGGRRLKLHCEYIKTFSAEISIVL